MSTTYTEHYSFGKQENYADLFSMKVITDNWDSLDTILYGFSTGKQDKLSATNKLSVAFVDFTPAQIAALGSGITDDDVEQIDLNKNNILFNAQQGVTNVATVTSGTYTATSGMRYTSIPLSTTLTGDITVVIGGLSSTATGTQCAVQLTDATTTLWQTTATRGSNIVLSAHIDSPATKLNIYCGASYQTTSAGDTVTWTDLMVCPTSLYTGTYRPYAMSNAELTAKEQQNESDILLNENIALTYTTNSFVTSTSFNRIKCRKVSPHLLIINLNLIIVDQPATQMADFVEIGTLPTGITTAQDAFAESSTINIQITGNKIKFFALVSGGADKISIRGSIPVVIN